MAYIYDYSNLTQSNSPKGPYKGAKGNLTIGTNAVNTPFNFWDGCLDQIGYFARAKK
jgi:hypothetical protein